MSWVAWPEMTLADSCALPTYMSHSGTDTHPQGFAAETHLTLDTVTQYIRLPSAVAFQLSWLVLAKQLLSLCNV